ncbi:hypothetical protein FJV41_32340 [Myxococcus llanfairpwllgwyngyllgogerychwyrndrobwllllantysiliogogogochensis]|uniref:Lipoprotein n=1 Tax=Myxococcus llanfairpwllgwyngyllgogerychwyrndrobwllllantysiliogogogochensis TaxID=2590453 RepID=A0A540WS13_9BACT|nr:hypothetical protein [Myxococcus llanfairpwllgwyngyllgogerychwyrndrobwllllantysiliogogogochensis]TQF11811.1 hypothetical protein FJV41_32340 [Myxococcus llanfairpwllgwyngyllgogerychwyrndrobwllllantysiliogogogochensis]
MPRRPALPVVLLLSLSSAFLLGAAPPAATGAASSAPVTLRWKVPPESLGYAYTTEDTDPQGGRMRVDLSSLKSQGVSVGKRRQLFTIQQPTQAEMVLVLTPKPSGDVAAKVVVTRMDMPKARRPSKQDQSMAKAMKSMEGTVQLRGSLTPSGLVTSDLKREQRNLLAFMVELPTKPVSVGEVWTHSADLLKMGGRWQGEHEVLNRVELVALEREAEGRTVAVIDFTLAERHDGKFEHSDPSKSMPGMMEMSYVARGEFLVEEGRWRRIAGQMSTLSKGLMTGNTAQRFAMVPLAPIPAEVLAAE